MQRYFFRLEAPHPSDDDEGALFESLDLARADAVRFLSDMLSDRAREIGPGENWRVSVKDHNGIPVCVLDFQVW